MRRMFACAVFAAVLAGARGQEQKADAIKVDAAILAREFEKDADEARKKYDAKGATIEVTGLVASVNSRRRTVALDTGAKVSIVLQAKKITGPDQKSRRLAAQTTGKFTRFDRNTVFIDCDEATLLRVVEEKK